MRGLTGQDIAVLNAPDSYSIAARVWVWNGTGWEDVTSLEGRDWLVEVAWDESVNEPCAQATVQLRRRQEDLTLNPLVSNKLLGVLALARPFYIEVATLPLGDRPQPGDWREVFRGRVEKLSLDKDPLTFTGRDDGGALIRRFIETEVEYGSDSGVAVETVIQSILTDNSTGVTLYTPTATGAVFSKFKQKKAPVMAAVREAALRIGWDLRYRWDDGTSSFRLTLYEPDRLGALGSQWSFPSGQVKAVTRLEQELADVRNAVRLYYYNRSALDSGGKPTRAQVDVSDAASITAYGRQWMQLSEDEDSPVDSPSEAAVMANGALADLKEPLLNLGVEVGLHYGIQLGDLLTFEADGEHFSSDQTLAVVSASHRVSRRGHRTSLALRGKPVAAQAGWLRREARVVRQPPAYTPSTVTGLAATPTPGGSLVTFTAPTAPPLPVEYELHVSTTNGFSPSAATLRERANRTSFELTGLLPGTTYYARVVPRTISGGQGAASSQVTIVPRYVEPRTLQPYIWSGAIPPNASFEASNDGTGLPDTWTFDGTWGVDAELDTSTSYSGAASVKFIGTGDSTRYLTSQAFTVRAGSQYHLDVNYKQASPDASALIIQVEWFGRTFASVGIDTLTVGSTDSSPAWNVAATTITAPSSGGGAAAYAKVKLRRILASVDVWVDAVELVRVPEMITAQPTWTAVTYSSTWVDYGSGFAGARYYKDTMGVVRLSGVTKSGTVGSTIFTLPIGHRPDYPLIYWVYTETGTAGRVDVNTNGTVVFASGNTAGVVLEGITFRAA